MARGFLGGIVVGGIFSVAAAGGLSLYVGAPEGPKPDAQALEVPAGSEFDQSRDDESAELPAGGGDAPMPGAAPVVAAPQPDDLSSLEGADTMPGDQPVTAQPDTGMTAPETASASDAPAAGTGESPVLPNPQAALPAAPETEENLSISTDPAQPVMPSVQPEDSAFPQENNAPEAAGEGTAPDGEQTQTAPVTANDSTAPEVATEGPAMTAPAVETETAAAPETTTEPVTQPVAAPAEEQAAEPVEKPEGPAIGKPARRLTDNNAQTGRLPSVTVSGDEKSASEDQTEEQPAAADLPPLKRYAAPFENPDNKPMMSIVLIDNGQSPIGVEAVKAFPYPISFAVDTSWSGAKEAMTNYRAAGFEVLALSNLPEGARASDVEVALSAQLSRVSDAVAVMEGDKTGLQSSREISDQVTQILLDSGHGLVLFPKGLDTARKLASREGVAAASVFRDFDSKGQSAAVIRRFLDQAAFKAGQEKNGVIMVGRLQADTISALMLWGLQDRASRVALAPISAVLDPAR